jgi:hypothetical protein
MAAVAVDFDGVIHAYSRGWADGTIYDEPVPGAFAALRALMREYAVFVHTTRRDVEVAAWIEDRSGIHAWALNPELGMEFWEGRGSLLVTNRKLPAMAYIDDRGIRFESWDQTLADLKRWCA